VPITDWKPSRNRWDWLGHGVYFWEPSPQRALRWAQERYGARADAIGVVVQLGRCFDLLDESITSLLTKSYQELVEVFSGPLPVNSGRDAKRRELDCLVINYSLDRLKERGIEYDTVRGAFLEGAPVYPGSGFSQETHIQLAVRNAACILGVFRPNLTT